MKKKQRIAVLVAIALAVPGVGNWDRQAADAMTADTAQSPVADITESANQAELYHKVYKENTAGHISYSLQDDTGNTLSRYTSSAAAKNKRSMALPASYDPRGTEQETPIRNQQDTGACWAFGALKALESDCLMKGILTKDAFTAMHSTAALSSSSDDEDAAVTSGLLVTMTPYTHVPSSAVTDYEALLMPDASGATRWRDLLGDVWTGCFAVTSSCEDPAAALRWVDALYGEEGALLAYAGIEGEDYAWNADGTWSFKVTNSRTINDIRANVLMYTGAAMPGLYPGDFIAKVDSPVDAHVFEQNERVHAVSEQIIPAHALSPDDQQRADALTAVLGGLVDRGIARFATGEIELNDETYATWLAELKAAGSDELAALYGGIR